MKHFLTLLYCMTMLVSACAQTQDSEYGIISKTDSSVTFAVDEGANGKPLLDKQQWRPHCKIPFKRL